MRIEVLMKVAKLPRKTFDARWKVIRSRQNRRAYLKRKERQAPLNTSPVSSFVMDHPLLTS